MFPRRVILELETARVSTGDDREKGMRASRSPKFPKLMNNSKIECARLTAESGENTKLSVHCMQCILRICAMALHVTRDAAHPSISNSSYRNTLRCHAEVYWSASARDMPTAT